MDPCILFPKPLRCSDIRYVGQNNKFIFFSVRKLSYPGYFLINEPAAQRQWVNNAANLVTWSKGLLDGIDGFDVEMARMSTDGLTLVARNGEVRPCYILRMVFMGFSNSAGQASSAQHHASKYSIWRRLFSYIPQLHSRYYVRNVTPVHGS